MSRPDVVDDSPSQRRVLLINLDFRDFVYSYMWGSAVLAGCLRRGLPVDMVAVNPFAGRDAAAELGVSRSALTPRVRGTVTYVDNPDESRSRAIIGQLLDRHRYTTLIVNCEAGLFRHLLLDCADALAGARWLVYDRHLHVDLRAHDDDAQLRDRMIASGLHLFTIQEIAIGGPLAGAGSHISAATDYVRSLNRLGLTADKIHFQLWPLDDAFFAPQPPARSSSGIVVFSGGDSGRDYATLFQAIHDLPVQLRLCAAHYPTPVPPNVTVLPRLSLHQFRDEVARATILAVPLSGHPPVSGITVVAIGKMLGKPVIASDNPVVRMHIAEHGAGGYLTPIGDVASFRSRLQRLIDDAGERQRLGEHARTHAARDLSLRGFVDRLLAGDEPGGAASDADAAEPPALDTADALERFRIVAKCGSEMRVEVCSTDVSELTSWMREHIATFLKDNMRGPLYVFLRQAPDPALVEALRCVVTDHRVQPAVVVTERISRAHLELLRRTGVRALYVTLYGATPAVHDARTGDPGSWRRALALIVSVPQVLERVRVGIHFVLSSQSAEELTNVLQVARRVSNTELLLWDAAAGGIDLAGLEPAEALRLLDVALRSAQKLGVPVRPVGFERTRALPVEAQRSPCLLNAAVSELLRDGVPLPSAAAGVLATDGTTATISEVAATGSAVVQLGVELAASGTPVLDLPPCLGGPPPETRAPSRGTKTEACRRCPIDRRCSGVPSSLMAIAGLHDEIRPPRHWLPLPEPVRVAVLCPPAYDMIYGAAFFGVARWLAGLGARVDLVTPWEIHADIPASFPETQRMGRPPDGDELERFIADGPVERYDLIVTPDPKITHPLVVQRRLRPQTRLAVTDFHMLGGMDEWVRDLCPSTRRPEQGGWWPSEQIILYSAFPGYGWLYTRYGIPMRQVAWQPYALDQRALPAAMPVAEATAIVSGGNHLRDLDTLLAAARQLGHRVHPIDLFASVPVSNVPPQVRFGGVVSTSNFCQTVGRSRFMVVPLVADANYAAGVTAMVTAIMYGRPLVVTRTAAALDYVIDGVNGLLVRPGDPHALASAIERLDTDDTLLGTLAAGAREAATKLTTEAWARALLRGSATYDADHWAWTKWRSRRARP